MVPAYPGSVATNLEKPGILGEFSEPGKVMEFSGILCNLGKL